MSTISLIYSYFPLMCLCVCKELNAFLEQHKKEVLILAYIFFQLPRGEGICDENSIIGSTKKSGIWTGFMLDSLPERSCSFRQILDQRPRCSFHLKTSASPSPIFDLWRLLSPQSVTWPQRNVPDSHRSCDQNESHSRWCHFHMRI